MGPAQDFLQLSDAEERPRGTATRLEPTAFGVGGNVGDSSPVELARRLKSSQSRVAKMEAGDSSVSVDLLVRSLFAIGARPKDLAKDDPPIGRPGCRLNGSEGL